jgi:hypothetical protein
VGGAEWRFHRGRFGLETEIGLQSVWPVGHGDKIAIGSGISRWSTASKWPGWGRWVGLRCRPSPGQALRDDAQDPVGSVEGADAQRGGLAYPQTARILAARHVLWIGLRIPPSRRRT